MSNEATPVKHPGAGTDSVPGNIASYIDHTLLKPEAGEADVLKVCAEAAEYSFKSVCVNPAWVKTVKTALKGSGVLTCSVVGFPLGATPTDVKTFEARGAVLDGADEWTWSLTLPLPVRAIRARSLRTSPPSPRPFTRAGPS